MRSISVLIASVLFGLSTVACGEARRDKDSASQVSSKATATGATGPGTVPPDSYLKGDDDADAGAGLKDQDDSHIRGYGHAASPTNKRAVTALVQRYYEAAAAGDGNMACRLMRPRLAKGPNLGDAAEEAYPPAPSDPSLHGKSCVQIMSLLFREDHERLAAASATLYVIAVRTDGIHGLALLGFKTLPERQIPVTRESHTWKIGSLLDTEIV